MWTMADCATFLSIQAAANGTSLAAIRDYISAQLLLDRKYNIFALKSEKVDKIEV